ncbi:MAG: DnaB-like helicase N-terminal domain-containing protein, partial [Akkermansiaceae bacterium]
MASDTTSPKKAQNNSGPKLLEAPPTDTQSAERALPHAIGPEKSILSSMFQDPQEYIAQAIENKLTEGHFYHPAHGSLFAILQELFEKNEPVELISFSEMLKA